MNDELLLRYSRHILLEEIGSEAQQRILDATMLVVGAGGLGSPATMYLAAAGVGRILPGETRAITLPPCPPPQCDTVLRVGGRLAVSGGSRQTTFSFPLQVTARLLAER